MFLYYVFWLSFFSVLYTWLIYPLCLIAACRVASVFRTVRSEATVADSDGNLPSISVIVAAYNEGAVIGRRIENLLDQDYPASLLEIIVASDGSADNTVDAAESYSSRGVKVLAFPANRGKAPVHNDAVNAARSEIIVFTDADTTFDRRFLREIAASYSDKTVGCVVGRLVYRHDPQSAVSTAEGAYFRYEVLVRTCESKLGILVAATGAAMSCRKSLFEPVHPNDDADVSIPLVVAFRNFKTVFAKDAVAYDIPPLSAAEEIRYRVRDTALSLGGTMRFLSANIWRVFRRPLVAWGILSHRLLRWGTPFFLAGSVGANLALVGAGEVYEYAFAAQALFYLLALGAIITDNAGLRTPRIMSLPYSFLLANYGIMAGVFRFLAGRASSSWQGFRHD